MNRFRLCQMYVSHIWHVIEDSSVCTIYKSLSVQALQSRYVFRVRVIVIVIVRVNLWLAVVYHQSVRLGTKPLESHDQHFFFFFQMNPYGHSLSTDHGENSAYSSSFVACRFIATETCLLCCCLAMATFIHSTIPAFSCSCHNNNSGRWSTQILNAAFQFSILCRTWCSYIEDMYLCWHC
jgi:hypothetical protein